MATTTKIVIEMPFVRDFMLQRQIQKAMRKDWEDSIMVAKSPYYDGDSPLFAELIDQSADILLQIINQIGYQ